MKVPSIYALRRARLTVLLAGSVLSVDEVLPLPRKRRPMLAISLGFPKFRWFVAQDSRERLNMFHRLDCRFSVADTEVTSSSTTAWPRPRSSS